MRITVKQLKELIREAVEETMAQQSEHSSENDRVIHRAEQMDPEDALEIVRNAVASNPRLEKPLKDAVKKAETMSESFLNEDDDDDDYERRFQMVSNQLDRIPETLLATFSGVLGASGIASGNKTEVLAALACLFGAGMLNKVFNRK